MMAITSICLSLVLGWMTLFCPATFGQAAIRDGFPTSVKELPKKVVAKEGALAIFVDWGAVKATKSSDYGIPIYPAPIYIVNRSNAPIHLLHDNGSSHDAVLECKKQDGTWARTHPIFFQFGGCGNDGRGEYTLAPSQFLRKTVLLFKNKTGQPQEIRFRGYHDGFRVASNVGTFPLDLSQAAGVEEDDWTIEFGELQFLEDFISGKIKFKRPVLRQTMLGPIKFDSKVQAIRALARPWHDREKVVRLLDRIIAEQPEKYAEVAKKVKADLRAKKRRPE